MLIFNMISSSEIEATIHCREYRDCGICYQALSRKRTVRLICNHVLHRTCFLDWCESSSEVKEELVNCCPICNFSSGNDIHDEKNRKLPTVFAFGPTGQPSKHIILSLLKNPYCFITVIEALKEAVHFLRDVTDDLLSARKSHKSEEYIQDIIDERNKLLDRFAISETLLLEYAAIKACIERSTHRADDLNQTSAFGVRLLVSREECHAICGICFEKVKDKHWVTLIPCQHYCHRTCALRWFESLESEKACPDCNVRIVSDVSNEMGKTLTRFLFFGLNGTISQEKIAPLELKRDPDIMEQELCWVVSSFLEILMNLVNSYYSGASNECIEDCFEEFRILVNRYKSIDEMLNAHTQRCTDANEQPAQFNELKPCQTAIVEAVTEDDECSFCLEPLSMKRTIHLDVCSHRYHRTCAMRWYEAKEVGDDLLCCICQRTSTRILDNRGSEIHRSYPFEDIPRTEDIFLLCRPEMLTDFFDDFAYRIIVLFKNIVQERKGALRDGKSGEYIADIDEEMDKLRKRSVAIDNHQLIIVEWQETNRIN